MTTTLKIIDSDFFKAALLCSDPKNVRPYLHGVRVDPARGTVAGTDGLRLFVSVCLAPLDPDDFPPPPGVFSLRPETAVPARLTLDHIEIEESGGPKVVVERATLVGTNGQRVACAITETLATAPHERLLEQAREPLTEHAAVCFDPRLLVDLSKVLGADGVVLGFGDKMPALAPVRQFRVRFLGIGAQSERPAYDCLLAPRAHQLKPEDLRCVLTNPQTL